MLRAARRRPPPLPAALAAASFAYKTQPQPPPAPPLSPQLVDAVVSRCPSDALALSFFLWCARRPGYFHPPCSFDRLLPAATRLTSRLGTASSLVRELHGLGCPIRPHVFLLLLRLYWRGGLYPLVLQLFEQMLLWGFHPNAFARNVILDVLLRTGDFDAAQRLLRDNPSPNYLTYAIVLTHLCRAGNWPRVRSCFVEMLRMGFLPSAASLTAVFACCSKAGTLLELLQLLAFTHVLGCKLTSVMWTCLIARLCHEGRLDEACTMLVKMVDSGSSPTVVTYTSLVRGLLQAGRNDEVIELLQTMVSTSCSPDLVLYNVLMDSMAKQSRYTEALYIYYKHIDNDHMKPDAYTLSTLARVLQLSQDPSLVAFLPRMLLRSDIPSDLVACNSVLSALCKLGFPSQAIQFYIDKFDSHIRPDRYTYVEILDSLFRLGRVNDAMGFYYSIVANDPESSAYVRSAILCGLVRQGRSLVALRILREAVRENYAVDAVCYTIVLHGLLRAYLIEEACRLFDQMKHSGIAPNICTYNVMLHGLCRARELDVVKKLLTEIECADIALDSASFSSVFFLLSKPRCTDSALEVVRQMLHLGMEQGSALEVVRQMLELGIKLDTVTCSVLSQSIGHEFILEDNTTAQSDGSESSNDLLICSAS